MKPIGIGIAVIAALFVLYKISYPSYTYRFRMTVNVDAGGETRSASSVIEVTLSKQPKLAPEIGPLAFSARGQAVFVALPGGKNLVALLAWGPTGANRDHLTWFIPPHFNLSVFRDRDLVRLPELRGHWDLPADQLPTLITVANPNDARTAQVVRPDEIEQRLGVRLRSIAIDLTTDPVVSPDIETKLPFLVKERQNRLTLDYPNKFTPNYLSFVRS